MSVCVSVCACACGTIERCVERSQEHGLSQSVGQSDKAVLVVNTRRRIAETRIRRREVWPPSQRQLRRKRR